MAGEPPAVGSRLSPCWAGAGRRGSGGAGTAGQGAQAPFLWLAWLPSAWCHCPRCPALATQCRGWEGGGCHHGVPAALKPHFKSRTVPSGSRSVTQQTFSWVPVLLCWGIISLVLITILVGGGAGIIVPILQMRRLRLRKPFTEGDTAHKLQSWDLHPGAVSTVTYSHWAAQRRGQGRHSCSGAYLEERRGWDSGFSLLRARIPQLLPKPPA